MHSLRKIRNCIGNVFLRFCLISLLLPYYGSSYAEPTRKLDEIKAAYIYNFTKYIEFPEGRFDEDATNDFNLCIKNAPEFIGLFETIEGVKIKDRDFKVRFIDDKNNLDQCHFLYLQPGSDINMDEIVNKSQEGRFLTISSEPDFAYNGGMIGFILINDKLKVEINLESTRQAGFTVSARLLEVSHVAKQK